MQEKTLKPRPIKLYENQDERLQLIATPGSGYIELFEKEISVRKAKQISEWLTQAIKWLEERKAKDEETV